MHKINSLMSKEKKIALTVNKYNFKEAEDADDKYWEEQSSEYCLNALMDLRTADSESR